jgi:hypothetical protein
LSTKYQISYGTMGYIFEKEAFYYSCPYEFHVLFYYVEFTLNVFIELSDTSCISHVKTASFTF